jgi:hypothetical protein
METLHGRKLWLGRIAFLLLFSLLISFLLLGRDAYYKYLVLRSMGIDVTMDSHGDLVLHPFPHQLAADEGVKDGDILLSVNGVQFNPNISIQNNIQALPVTESNHLKMDLRGSGFSMHQVEIDLVQPRTGMFNLSVLQVARYLILLDILFLAGFLVPTLIIFFRKSDDRMGLFVTFVLLLTTFRFTRVNLFVLNPLASMVVFFLYSVARILLLVFLFTFPDGRFVPRWSRYFVWVGGAWAGLSTFFSAFYGPSGQVLDLAIFATGLWAQIYRYRHVSGTHVQHQTKWIVYGLIIAHIGGYFLILIQFLPSLREAGYTYLRVQMVGELAFTLFLLTFPVTVMVSILRYHLYDIDTIINRTLVYGLLTAIVTGLASALTGFFQRLFVSFTGVKTEVFLVITTLIVASAITPLKAFLQTIVDKRFKEAPNPQKKLSAFATLVKERISPVNAPQITHRLLEEVVDAFKAKGGAVKLVNPAPVLTQGLKTWNGEEHIQVPIQSEGKNYGLLVLGKRTDGSGYTARDRQLLHEIARQTARAISEDEQFFCN